MSFNYNILINAGAIPVFIEVLNKNLENPEVLLGPLTMLANFPKKTSYGKTMYDNNDCEIVEAVFKVIAKNSKNMEILIKCIAIISNIDTNITMNDATNAILFCEAVSFVTSNKNNVESTANAKNHDPGDDPDDFPDDE
jgi:hypothetical protein